MLQTSANPTRRINASSGFYYAVLPSFAGWPFILVTRPYLLAVCGAYACDGVRACSRTPIAFACIASWKRMLDACVRSSKFIPEGVKSLVQRQAFQGHVWLVLSIYRCGTCAAGCARRPMGGEGRGASSQRNTNVYADSFWFGHLSRHWSPCGVARWWQTDCHLWMKGDRDASRHMSLSGVQVLGSVHLHVPRFIHPSSLSLWHCSVVITPFLPPRDKELRRDRPSRKRKVAG